MVHVNKGAIACKMDAARNVRLINTSVNGLVNLGLPGDGVCGDYTDGVSHPAAALHGYGWGGRYTFADSSNVTVSRATAGGRSSMSGAASVMPFSPTAGAPPQRHRAGDQCRVGRCYADGSAQRARLRGRFLRRRSHRRGSHSPGLLHPDDWLRRRILLARLVPPGFGGGWLSPSREESARLTA